MAPDKQLAGAFVMLYKFGFLNSKVAEDGWRKSDRPKL